MTSSAISAHGTLLQMGDAAPGTYATISEVKDIKGPDISPTYEDVTNHSSGGWAEKKVSLMDGGKLTCKVNFINDSTQNNTTGLRNRMYNKTLSYFKIIYPDSTYETFTAYPKIIREAPVKGMLTADVELTITGPITPGG